MRSGKVLLGLAAAGSIVSTAGAQFQQKVLIKDNDTIVGIGAMESISYVQVNDIGMWTAWVQTNNSDTTRDVCILRNGFVTLREGSPLFTPPNTILDDFLSVNMSESGHLGMVLKLLVNGSAVTHSLYWNTVMIAKRLDVLNAPPTVGSGTTWENMDVCKINAANEVFVLGDLNNPANGTGRDPSLTRFKLDQVGNILETEVLLTRGMFLPSLGTTVNDLPTTEHSLAVNKHGDYMTLVMGLGGAQGNAYMINGETIVAAETQPSPVPGRNWTTLTNTPKISLNDNGDYAFTGSTGGATGYLVVKNGEKFAQQGDVYPTFSPSPLLSGTAAPLYIANDGNMFWRADTTLNDDAYLRNFIPIVQANVTTINGDLVTSIETSENAHSVSRNGRFWVGRVDLQLGGDAALLVDFGLVLPIPGCQGNEGKLAAEGMALPGSSLEFSMDLGHAVGALPIVLFSTRQAIPGSDCGVTTQYGELLISNAHRVGRLTLPAWNGNQPSTLTAPIPTDLSLVNQTFFAQGLFRAPGQPAFSLTNGLRIEIGAP